jgi:hypothetical protein
MSIHWPKNIWTPTPIFALSKKVEAIDLNRVRATLTLAWQKQNLQLD